MPVLLLVLSALNRRDAWWQMRDPRWIARIVALPLALAAAPSLLPSPVAAQDDGAASSTVYIDVTGMGGERSSLTIGYPDEASLGTALEDLKAVVDASGWQIGPATATPPDQSRSYETGVTPGISVVDGHAPVYPFVHAFRRFPTVEITLIGESTGPTGDFAGENRYVSAEWRRKGNVTIFTYTMKDRDFQGEADVLLADGQTPDDPVADSRASQREPRPYKPSTWHLWVLLVMASIGAGIFAWGITWWGLSRFVPGINGPEKKGNAVRPNKDTGLSASLSPPDADLGTDDGPGEGR